MQFLKFSIFILLVFVANTLFAAWLRNEPQTIVQPDGTQIHCFATGDEFYNWLHDANGFTIIQNPETGVYSYAILADGKLKPSQIIPGKDDPAGAGLLPWINISPEQMKAKRNEFYAHHMPQKSSIPGYNAPDNQKNIGTLNNLVLYIRFADQNEFTDDTTLYTNMFNNPAPGYNSMLNYFKFASYNKLTLPSHFFPTPPTSTIISYQDIFPRSYFMPYNSVTNPNGYQEGEQGEREHALLKRAVEHIASEVPVNLDIDYNNDGLVDNVVFIIKGGTTAWATLLWPHRWALYGEEAFINGKRVWDYNFQLTSSLQSSGNGVLCHEMFHSLGSPDLYHYNSTPVDPIGGWDIMCSNHNPPQLMGAYMKYRYGGWLDAIPQITECGTYTLNPVSLEENNSFKIASPNSSTDYFLVEYRKKEGTFEGTLTASGLLIYKINTLEDGNGNAQGPPDEVYIYRPGGTLNVNGSLNDAVFAGDYGRTEFNDNTNPSGFLSNGSPAGIDIFNIGMIGETISFDVRLNKAPVADLKASETLITAGCAVNFTDLSVCDVDSWLWSFPGGNPSASTEQNPQGIAYPNPGSYSVTLKATNAWGENTRIYQDYITVSNTALPVADFTVSDSVICTGEVVTFTDRSSVCPNGWNWVITPGTGFAFADGTNANSQNPGVVFNEPYDQYSVKLIVSNANGSSEILKSGLIAAGGLMANSYTQSFEYPEISASGWNIENPDNKATWKVFNTDGSGAGTKAAGIGLFDYYSFGQRDRLISPPLNLKNPGDYFLSFKHAYAQTVSTYSDSLIVKISDDCGNNWTRIMAMAENGTGNFATSVPMNTSFIPASPEDWCEQNDLSECYSLNISNYQMHPNVMIMFESVKGVGNNLFIDDIRIDLVTGTGNPVSTPEESFSIFPNPNNGYFTLIFTKMVEPVVVEFFNSKGQFVRQIHIDPSDSGQTFDWSGEPKGLYFARIIGETGIEIQKVVIE